MAPKSTLRKVLLLDISFDRPENIFATYDPTKPPPPVKGGSFLLQIIDFGGAQGAAISTMRQFMSMADKISDAVDEESDHVLLDAGEHKLLLQAVEAFPFRNRSWGYVKLYEAMQNAESVPVIEDRGLPPKATAEE